ncbi:MAG: hypothetical protein JWM32_1055 [Verrucomicrobia bacterium]|nr:hypothetical protein [Verrucomicrobiota bacterium]
MKTTLKRTGPWLDARWQLTVFLCFAAGLNYADRAAFSSVLAPLRQELGLSDVALGLLGSVFLWSYALASPFAGLLADRCSRSRLVRLSLLLWSAVTLLTGMTTGLVALCILRISLGLAESLYFPAAIALIADHHGTSTRGRALGFHSVGLNLGVVAGASFAGILAEHYGWRSGFLVLGGVGLVLAFAGKFFLRDGPVAPLSAPGKPRVAEALAYLVRVPSFYILLAKTMLAGFTIWIFLGWLPLYFRENFHLNLGAAGFAGTFMLQVAATLGTGVGGWISDAAARRGKRQRMLVIACCYLAASPILLVFLGHPDLSWVIASISAFSFVRGLGEGSEKPLLCEVIPAPFRSTALGLMNMWATAAGGIGVLGAGFMKRDLGLNAVFASSSLIFFGAAIMLFFGYRFFLPADIARAEAYEAAGNPRDRDRLNQA